MILASALDRHQVEVKESSGAVHVVVVDGVRLDLRIEPLATGVFRIWLGDRPETVHCVADGPTIHLFWQGRAYRLRRESGAAPTPRTDDPGAIEAPMPGRIIEVQVSAGDTVRQGQPMVVIEAMKMETVARAPRDGRVRRVRVAAGERVAAGAILVEME